MSMYTELSVGFDLKVEIPPDVIATLERMVAGYEDAPTVAPHDHQLFSTSRWWWMLKSAGSCFDRPPETSLTCNGFFEYYSFGCSRSIKNYDNEWELFLAWLEPWIETEGYIGTLWYKGQETPDLLYVRSGKVRRCRVVEESEGDLL